MIIEPTKLPDRREWPANLMSKPMPREKVRQNINRTLFEVMNEGEDTPTGMRPHHFLITKSAIYKNDYGDNRTDTPRDAAHDAADLHVR